MKTIAGIEIIETRADLEQKLMDWNDNWSDEIDEMARNAKLHVWLSSVSEEEFSAVINHPRVTLYGPAGRNTIMSHLKI